MHSSRPFSMQHLRKNRLAMPDPSLLMREVGIPAAKRLRMLLVVLLATLVFIGAGDDSARVERLGHQMMCVCGGCNQTLLECNHVGCGYSTRMREELTAAVNRGESDNVVLQSFIQNYGTTVLSTPTKSGFSLIAWIMPYFALVFGILLVVFVVRAWRNRPLLVQSATAPLRADELQRFRDQARRETGL